MPTLIKNIAEQLQQEHQMIGAAAKELQDLVRRPLSPREEQSDWLSFVRDSLLSSGFSSQDALCLRGVWRLHGRGGGDITECFPPSRTPQTRPSNDFGRK